LLCLRDTFFVVYSSFDEGGGEQSSKLSKVRGGGHKSSADRLVRAGQKQFRRIKIPLNVAIQLDVEERRDSVETSKHKICGCCFGNVRRDRQKFKSCAARGWAGSSEAVKDFPG
jgi:hypothetical protein